MSKSGFLFLTAIAALFFTHSVQAQSCSGSSCNGLDAVTTGCSSDAYTVKSRDFVDETSVVLGTVYVLHSPTWPESQRSSVSRKPSSAELASVESSCFKGVVNSVALEMPLVAYPPQAMRRGIGGKVRIKIFVDEKGTVYYASVVDGPSSLRKVSLQSARGSRFAPFTKDEKPIKCAGLLVYTFNPPKL